MVWAPFGTLERVLNFGMAYDQVTVFVPLGNSWELTSFHFSLCSYIGKKGKCFTFSVIVQPLIILQWSVISHVKHVIHISNFTFWVLFERLIPLLYFTIEIMGIITKNTNKILKKSKNYNFSNQFPDENDFIIRIIWSLYIVCYIIDYI